MVLNAVWTISPTELKFARPRIHPSQAHEPNATSIFDFWRISLAMCSFSSLRIPPLKRVSKMEPSSIASTSLYLASIAMGQKTTSKLASTSRIFSWVLSTAISQPPQEAAQYIANLGFPLAVMLAPPQAWRFLPASFPVPQPACPSLMDLTCESPPRTMSSRWQTVLPLPRWPKQVSRVRG